jgi:hypothetical protein
MLWMLCRNKVTDFAARKAVFDSHREAQEASGLTLENLWRSIDDPNHIFFLFAVADLHQAKAFISSPDAARAAQETDVIEGEYWFVR